MRFVFRRTPVVLVFAATLAAAGLGSPARTVRPGHLLPLLATDPPHPVVAFHPAGADLRLYGFDQRTALFEVESSAAPERRFLVEPEPLGVPPPLLQPLGEDVAVEVPGSLNASYVLYLPAGYDPSRPPPLILAFPPFGDGKRFIQPLKASAERLGWVLVGCNGLANGRNEVFFPTAREIVRDVRRRVAHDRRREVLLGFSGGAMGSYRLSRTFWDEFAALVAFGGWLGVYDEHLVYPSRLVVAMLNGNRDGGARENEARDREVLEEFGVASRIFRFKGGHVLPPPKKLDEALEWVVQQWERQPATRRDADSLLSAAVAAQAEGRTAEAVERSLDLILEHGPTWQAAAAEELLASILGSGIPVAGLELQPRGEQAPRILYAKARGMATVAARLAYLEAGLLLSPGDAQILSRLAFELWQADPGSSRVRELSEQAVLHGPDYWLSHFVLGMAREAGGDRPGAVEAVRRALELAPNEFQVLCRQTLEGWGVAG